MVAWGIAGGGIGIGTYLCWDVGYPIANAFLCSKSSDPATSSKIVLCSIVLDIQVEILALV